MSAEKKINKIGACGDCFFCEWKINQPTLGKCHHRGTSRFLVSVNPSKTVIANLEEHNLPLLISLFKQQPGMICFRKKRF